MLSEPSSMPLKLSFRSATVYSTPIDKPAPTINPLKKSRDTAATMRRSPQQELIKVLKGRPLPTREPKKTEKTEGLVVDSFIRNQDGRQKAIQYAEQLKVYLEQHKVYPKIAKRMKHAGTVTVQLQINRDGTFENIRVSSPAPFDTLNRAALELFNKLGRFKAAPTWRVASKDFVVPVVYKLRRL